ncbi:hypothetical protein DINM_004922 [Dirofilaria immitis]|nr:hypothetical protein [Dirofilaria immitis]
MIYVQGKERVINENCNWITARTSSPSTRPRIAPQTATFRVNNVGIVKRGMEDVLCYQFPFIVPVVHILELCSISDMFCRKIRRKFIYRGKSAMTGIRRISKGPNVQLFGR